MSTRHQWFWWLDAWNPGFRFGELTPFSEKWRSLQIFLSLFLFFQTVHSAAVLAYWSYWFALNSLTVALPSHTMLKHDVTINKRWKLRLFFSFLWWPGGSITLLADGSRGFLHLAVIHQWKDRRGVYDCCCYEYHCKTPAIWKIEHIW